jgi:hypothetical protein
MLDRRAKPSIVVAESRLSLDAVLAAPGNSF